MIIYLHGLNSSAGSEKARLMVEYCGKNGIACAAPTLHHRPSKAMRQIEKYLADGKPHTVVGSSMGGFYATWLCEQHRHLCGVLINPAVKLADKLSDFVGVEQKNYNGGEDYLFEQVHLDEFRALETNGISDPQRYLLMVQKGDDLLDYREAVTFYQDAVHIVEEGGNHMFVDFPRHLSTITEFAAQTAS